jgi:hypothetical protein
MTLGAYWYGAAKAFPKGAALVAHLRKLKLHGVTRYIPQWGRDEGRKYVLAYNVQQVCADEGVELVLGLGLDTSSSTDPNVHAGLVERAIVKALDIPGLKISEDWEGWWDGKQAQATRVADGVLKKHPDAAARSSDAPWWAPLFYIDEKGVKRWTHPSAPTREFGRIVSRRYVQAYGAPVDGRSRSLLAWARSPTQYAALSAETGASWSVLPTCQMYARSLNDQIRLLLQESEQNLWTWNEADSNALLGLRVVAELAKRGFVGINAVREFQTAERIVVDGIVGPVTLGRLGL